MTMQAAEHRPTVAEIDKHTVDYRLANGCKYYLLEKEMSAKGQRKCCVVVQSIGGHLSRFPVNAGETGATSGRTPSLVKIPQRWRTAIDQTFNPREDIQVADFRNSKYLFAACSCEQSH